MRKELFDVLRATGAIGLASRLSRRQGRVPILMYHSIGRPAAAGRLPSCLKLIGMEVSFETFEEHAALLARHFRVIPLEDAVQALLRERSLPSAAVVVTFDDGYRDNFELAAPMLEKHGLPATFFIIGDNMVRGAPPELYEAYTLVDRLDGSRVSLATAGAAFDDFPVDSEGGKRALFQAVRGTMQRGTERERLALLEALRRLAADNAALPAEAGRQFMSADEVLALQERGFSIGGHSMSHRRLARLDEASREHEIGGSSRALREIGIRGRLPFAYPFGQPEDFDAGVQATARRYDFYCGLSTIRGLNRFGVDSYALERLEVRDWPREQLLLECSGLGEALRSFRR